MSFSFSDEQKQSLPWFLVGLLLAGILVLLGPMLTPFVVAAILAYALNPGVDWLATRRAGRFYLPRALAVLIVILLLMLTVLALILVVMPVLLKEIPLLQRQIPDFLDKLNATVAPHLGEYGIHVRLDIIGIKKILTQQLVTNGDEIWAPVLASLKTGGSALLTWLVNLLFIPMLLFYLLQDWHPFIERLRHMIPRRWVGKISHMAEEVDDLLAQYLRGQLLVMLILAAYYSIALGIVGFDIALPVGILTGVLVFIPYVGFGLGLTLALIAAVLQFTSLYGLMAVAIIYGVGQVVESFILTPQLVGERIGLHPLVVIFALLAFGQLFGFVGVLLALPASAIVSVGVRHLRQRYLSSSFYNREV
ncbi:MAG TPA: AI-2E family transporter [Herbaspirillum sp.]|nr:AI-2E family transporter [Herbaspirillum sp.]